MLGPIEDIRRDIARINTPVTGAWAQLDCTTHATPGTEKNFNATAVLARKAIVRAAETGNTNTIMIGPSTAATFAPLAANGGEYTIEAPLGLRFDLAAWYSKSDGAAQAFKVLYIA